MKAQLTVFERLRRVRDSLRSYFIQDRGFLARTEFWIYLPGESLPPQDAIMDRMMLSNPYQVRGVSPIGAAEGMLFSDVRTHIALILKAHNPQAFRGENFPDSIDISQERLSRITSSNSIAKVSYISEQPLANQSHVAFVTHAAAAIADLAEGALVYDLDGERLWDVKEFSSALQKNPKGDGADLHVRTMWEVVGTGSRIETRGLVKLGVPELRTVEMERDQHVVTEAVMTDAAELIWKQGLIPENLEIDLFGDTFKVEVSKRTSKLAEVRLLRMHLA